MSILKFVNDKNNRSEDLCRIIDYVTDSSKHSDTNCVLGYGCNPKRAIRDFKATKKVYHKTHGKQYEHFVLSITPDDKDVTDQKYMELSDKIAEYYNDSPKSFQMISALHNDTDIRHLHFVLNSASYKDGKKFSQSPSELNDFKLYCNKILEKYGFDKILLTPEKLREKSIHSFDEGYDFLEIYDDKALPYTNVVVDASNDSEFEEENTQRRINMNNKYQYSTLSRDPHAYNTYPQISYRQPNNCNPNYFSPNFWNYGSFPYNMGSPQQIPQQQMRQPEIVLNYSENITINTQSFNQGCQVLEQLKSFRNTNSDNDNYVENLNTYAEIDRSMIEKLDGDHSLTINRSRNIIVNFPKPRPYTNIPQKIIDVEDEEKP